MTAGREIGLTGKPGTLPEPGMRDFASNMKVYEASIHYTLVRSGHQVALNTPPEIVEYMLGAFDDSPLQESFYVVCLNRKYRPLCRNRITLGTATATLAHPREVFRIAVLASAAAIVCVHNHPSGDPSPSSADVAVTRQLHEAGNLMEIELLDHLIIGNQEDDPHGRGYFSFREAGRL